MRVIIGAGKTAFEGWVSTQESELNLLQEEDFRRLFAQERPAAMLAEHVWEHMTFEEGCRAAVNCYNWLQDGGYLRIAVPDANFRNEWYQNMVKVGGNGDPAHPALRTVLFMITRPSRKFFVVQALRWNCWNGATRTVHSTINTGMKTMDTLVVHSALTHVIRRKSWEWFRLYWMPEKREYSFRRFRQFG